MKIAPEIENDIARQHKAQGFLNKILKGSVLGGANKGNTHEQKLKASYQKVFNWESEAVNIVLRDLCQKSGHYTVNYDMDGIKEGKRALFLEILKMIND